MMQATAYQVPILNFPIRGLWWSLLLLLLGSLVQLLLNIDVHRPKTAKHTCTHDTHTHKFAHANTSKTVRGGGDIDACVVRKKKG